MPVEAKPLFRPDVLRVHLAAFALPGHVDAFRPKLAHWADLIASGKANAFKEQEILPDFLTDFFCELLGYTRPAVGGPRYTVSREKHVQVEGEFADAVLGDFGRGPERFIVALEGKGPKDPLDRPFGGRRMSAGLKALRDEHAQTVEPARSLAAEALKLEHAISDLVNEAYGLTPADVALLWETAPPRMPIVKPAD